MDISKYLMVPSQFTSIMSHDNRSNGDEYNNFHILASNEESDYGMENKSANQ